MDALNCIFNRRSVRSYLNKPVEFDKIALLLKAGSKAPSSGNLQDYRFIVITDKQTIKGIADHCTDQFWIAQAPALIVVCSDSERCESYYGLRGQRLYSIQNCAAATQNILLAAHNMELGTCWIGSFDETYLNDTLSIPDTVRPQALITVGYANDEPSEREEEPLDSMVYFNSYGNTIKNMNILLREYNKEIEKVTKRIDPVADNVIDKLRHHAKKLYGKAKENVKKSTQSLKPEEQKKP